MSSKYIDEELREAIKRAGQRLLDDALAMRPTLVGDSFHIPTTDYIIYEELVKRPAIIDSTATVIDENVKALPAPEVSQ